MIIRNKLNKVIIILAMSILGNNALSQTLKDVLSNKDATIVYLGIDFSKNKLLDNGNPYDIQKRLYTGINQLVINEPKKYNLSEAFHKSVIDYDLTATNYSNEHANPDEILSVNSSDFSRFSEKDINDIVKKLDITGKTGIGLLFVFESMRKMDKKGTAAVWVTFIDMKSKKILMTERMVSEGRGGIGFRNFWASSIKSLIDDIYDFKYKDWQKKYGR